MAAILSGISKQLDKARGLFSSKSSNSKDVNATRKLSSQMLSTAKVVGENLAEIKNAKKGDQQATRQLEEITEALLSIAPIQEKILDKQIINSNEAEEFVDNIKSVVENLQDLNVDLNIGDENTTDDLRAKFSQDDNIQGKENSNTLIQKLVENPELFNVGDENKSGVVSGALGAVGLSGIDTALGLSDKISNINFEESIAGLIKKSEDSDVERNVDSKESTDALKDISDSLLASDSEESTGVLRGINSAIDEFTDKGLSLQPESISNIVDGLSSVQDSKSNIDIKERKKERNINRSIVSTLESIDDKLGKDSAEAFSAIVPAKDKEEAVGKKKKGGLFSTILGSLGMAGKGIGKTIGKFGGLITAGFGSIFGKGKGIGKILGNAMKTFGKFGGVLKKLALPLVGVFAVFDAFKGFKNAADISGKAEDSLTTLDRAQASISQVASGLTLGLVDAKTIFKWLDTAVQFWRYFAINMGLPEIFSQLQASISASWESFKAGLIKAFDFIIIDLPGLIADFPAKMLEMRDSFGQAIESFFTNSFDFITNTIPIQIENVIGGITSKITETFTNMSETILNWFDEMGSSIIEKVKSISDLVLNNPIGKFLFGTQAEVIKPVSNTADVGIVESAKNFFSNPFGSKPEAQLAGIPAQQLSGSSSVLRGDSMSVLKREQESIKRRDDVNQQNIQNIANNSKQQIVVAGQAQRGPLQNRRSGIDDPILNALNSLSME